MPGSLNNSPADVLRWLLVQLGGSAQTIPSGGVVPIGLVTDPANNAAWPCFVADEPDSPDSCVTVYDTAGRDDGRSMIDGERYEHFGFQIRVRGAVHPATWIRARNIKAVLDQRVSHLSLSVGGSSYMVHTVSTSPILALGKETPKTKRKLFTINGVVALNELF